MDNRRRMTLSTADQNVPLQSSIPVPSSALKKRPQPGAGLAASDMRMSSKGRMSMAGPPGRTQVLGVLSASQNSSQGAGSQRRPSLWESQPRLPPMSASRGDAGYYGRTPNRNAPPGSVRRSSQYSGRASVAALVQLNQPKTEIRPIRDKQWQAMAHAAIANHLIECHYPLAITPKTLQSPTTKDFQTIFKFLISDVLDPGYTFGKGGKKFEDEVIMLLKDLRYPHADQLSRTSLTAVGSLHTWPSVLAMLFWMVELSQAKYQWWNPDLCDDPNLTPIDKLSPDQGNMAERHFVEYLNLAYKNFLEGSDDFGDLDQELREALERSSAGIIQEAEEKTALLQKTKMQSEQLRASSEMEQLEKEHDLQLADSLKFQKMIEHNNGKKTKLEDALQVLTSAIAEAEERLEKLRHDHQQLVKAVEEQNLSPEEATRMTTERDTLARTLEDLRTKIGEASKTIWEREMVVSKRNSTIEEALQEYMSLVYRVGLYPDPPDGFRVEGGFGIDQNLAVEDPVKIVTPNIRQTIRPAITRFGEEKRGVRTQIENDTIVVEDELDRVSQQVADQKERLEDMELRLTGLLEQADEVKEATAAETSASNTESSKLEREVANIRQAAQTSALALESRLQALEIQYADQQHKTAQLKEEVLKEIVNHTEAIVTFRTQVSGSLDSLALYAENN